jgi:hypothetical protein
MVILKTGGRNLGPVTHRLRFNLHVAVMRGQDLEGHWNQVPNWEE